MGSFWTDNAPTNTGVTGGMMGGFQPAPVGAPSNPTVTTQPQPYQQGPGGTQPSVIGGTLGQSLGMGSAQDAARQRLQQILAQHQGGFFGNIANALASPKMQGVLQQMDTPQGRLQALQQQHPAGSFWGNVTQAVTSPQAMQAYQSRVLNPAQQIGANVLGQIGQGSSSGAGLNGFVKLPAIPSNQSPQPMNPSQQSGQVGMMSPTGQFQYVNQEHVPHYQNMGATIHNGSSYGSQNGGF